MQNNRNYLQGVNFQMALITPRAVRDPKKSDKQDFEESKQIKQKLMKKYDICASQQMENHWK